MLWIDTKKKYAFRTIVLMKLKISVSCESGNKNKKKREVKHEKVTVSYESVRKNQQDSSCYEETPKKSVRIVP